MGWSGKNQALNDIKLPTNNNISCSKNFMQQIPMKDFMQEINYFILIIKTTIFLLGDSYL